MRRENALIMRQSPRWLQAFSVLMLTLGGGMLIGSFIFKIDEVVTATGRLESAKGKEIVKTPAGGKVDKVYVENGEFVEKGQPLVSFDTTMAEEEKEKAQALISLEKEGLKRKINSINLRKKTFEKQYQTQAQITDSYRFLEAQGSITSIQLLQSEDQLFTIETQLTALNEQELELKINADKRIRELQAVAKNADQQLKYKKVKAAKSGIVFDIQASNNGVLGAGEDIMSIVPEGSLSAKVYVPNKDIGFVKVGQNAKVRVDAFPASRYGELNGKITLIGADVLAPDKTSNSYRFPIDITLERSWLEVNDLKIPLRSGMAISSNLQIRKKRLISLVSDFFGGQIDSIKSLRGG